MNKIKVLFLSSWYPSMEHETLGNFVQKHAQAAGLFAEVCVLALFSSTKIKTLKLDLNKTNGITEIRVYYPKGKNGIGGKIKRFLYHRKAFFLGYQKANEILGVPDVVHLNVCFPMGIWALYLKRRKKIPFVLTEHSNGFHLKSNHAYPNGILKLCKRVLEKASYVMPVSLDLKNNLQQLAKIKKAEIVSNVVNENLFNLKGDNIKKSTQFVHISTGYDPQKNISGILNVVAELSLQKIDFNMLFINDGDVQYAKDFVANHKLNQWVTFKDTQTTQQIAQHLQNADALVLFSNYENFPCVIPESWMVGTPVIATAINGIPEHVNDNNGILVQKGNEMELKQAMLAMINHHQNFDSANMRKQALEHFSYRAIGEKFNQIYQQVLTT